MAQSSGRLGKASKALATIAVASLGGPVAVLQATLTELVTVADEALSKHSAERRLINSMQRELIALARAREIDSTQITAAFESARYALTRHGLTREGFADVGFNAAVAAEQVIHAVREEQEVFNRRKDRSLNWGDWDDGDFTGLVRASLRELYGQIGARLKSDDPTLTACFAVLFDRFNNLGDQVRQIGTNVTQVHEALAGVADYDLVVHYLLGQADRWDRPIWDRIGKRASALEQSLTLAQSPESTKGVTLRTFTPHEALAGTRLLAVLGGPGAGKTWLARWYARNAAIAALGHLEGGGSLEGVVLPIYTTWQDLADSDGNDIRSRLITAMFRTSTYAPPNPRDTQRLYRWLEQPGRRVLAVIDSLDEAADREDHNGHARLLEQIEFLSTEFGWQIIVTSRYGAWRAVSGSRSAARVVEIEDLRYPSDVVRFVRAWLINQPEQADKLLEQIERQPGLRRISVIPLLLTFSCIIAETGEEIPLLRRNLYQSVVGRLIREPWVQNRTRHLDERYYEDVLTVLRTWAWEAVRHANADSGLGNWGETFTPHAPLLADQARTLDHVAPNRQDSEGRTTRRFIHRTILEHLLAEHVARMGARRATSALKAHVWFDRDWEVAAPAAVAAHPDRDKLLRDLIPGDPTSALSGNSLNDAISEEARLFILRVAEESDPNMWDDANKSLINRVRTCSASSTNALEPLGASSHWKDSNLEVITRLLARLPSAYQDDIPRIAAALVELEADDAQRQKAISVLLGALPGDFLFGASAIADALARLATSDQQRQEAISGLLATLPTADGHTADIVDALARLATSDRQRQEVITALLATLPNDHGAAGRIAATLVRLSIGDAQRQQAINELLAALPTTYLYTADLADALVELATRDAQKQEAVTGLLATLPSAGRHQTDYMAAPFVAAALVELEADPAQRHEAVTGLLAALPGVYPHAAAFIAAALIELDADPAQKQEAITGLLAALPSASEAAVDIVAALQELDADETQRQEAIAGLLAALPSADQRALDIVAALEELDADETQRQEAIAGLLAALPYASMYTGAEIAAALVRLEANRPQKLEAISLLLAALPSAAMPGADLFAGTNIATALVALDADDAQRQEAITVLLSRLPTAGLAEGRIARALAELARNDTQRQAAITGLLAILPTAFLHNADIADALIKLATSDAQKQEAITGLLAAPLRADPHGARRIARSLRSMMPQDEWTSLVNITSS